MKVGIVVPYTWSYWGGVVDHAEEQARALEQLGVETRLVMGYDPPGFGSRLLHPRSGRPGSPPERVLTVGRSVVVPANGSLANIVLSPSAIGHIRSLLAREQFDVIHVHEPLTPTIGVAALALARAPLVATFHAAGTSRWRGFAKASWGFLLDRIDVRIAVSEAAAHATEAYLPGRPFRVIPNGVRIPAEPELGGRENVVVFIGRHEPRKGLPILLAAWPRVYRETEARLRVIGAEPALVRLLARRGHFDLDGVELVGPVPSDALEAELDAAKLLVAPSLGGESFGMVLIRAFAAGTPVVASDIDGYADVVGAGTGNLVPPGRPEALAESLMELLGDERRRVALAAEARRTAVSKYAWQGVAETLVEIYESLCRSSPDGATRDTAPLPVTTTATPPNAARLGNRERVR